jgi:hypothetical protein
MRTNRSTTLAAVAVALAAGAAGCGAGEGQQDSKARDQDRFERAALQHARCMREHGVDVPDPKPGDGGLIRIAPRAGTSPATEARAVKECEKYLKDLPPPKLSQEQKTEMRDAALGHARCMREQGIDFPDPTFSKDGGMTVKVGDDVRPDDPRVRAAEARCAKYMRGAIGGGPAPAPAP